MEQTNASEELKQELSEQETSEITWEKNHEQIIKAVRYLQDKRIKATVTNIAMVTKLSRPTVYKHLNEDAVTPAYKTYAKVNRLMMNDVLMRICEKAYYGDVKAARLYFELMGVIQHGNNKINTNILNCNNAVMVNGQLFTEEMITNLSTENLTQLEEFVKDASKSNTKGGLQNNKNISTTLTGNQ